jgi:hypothetical protein
MAPQVATRIPAMNSHTLPFRTNAAQARAASAASARRSISLKYSTKKLMKALLSLPCTPRCADRIAARSGDADALDISEMRLE